MELINPNIELHNYWYFLINFFETKKKIDEELLAKELTEDYKDRSECSMVPFYKLSIDNEPYPEACYENKYIATFLQQLKDEADKIKVDKP